MDGEKRKNFMHVVKVLAFLLCVLFFVCPLVKCSNDNTLTASGLEIATGTGKLFKDNNGHPVVFVLLLIPAAVLLLALLNKSFIVLRNTSIVGLVAKFLFLIAAYVELNSGDLGGAFVLTLGNLFVVLLYIGLIVFTQWCIKQEQAAPPDVVKSQNSGNSENS